MLIQREARKQVINNKSEKKKEKGKRKIKEKETKARKKYSRVRRAVSHGGML